MITISDGFAAVLVTALRDSFQRRSEVIDSNEVGDVTDLEEFLVHLGLLEGEVRKQYLAMQKQNPKMIPYADLWPELDQEPLDPPDETNKMTRDRVCRATKRAQQSSPR